ncbi:YdcH family protein [Roseibium sp.]|uniref:YdcH family protein n=1 Tax=Roseibium sp. TaxID=1936156 RepID=UPI003A98496F
MGDSDDQELRVELAQLRQEHRDLDAAVQALSLAGSADALQMQRLKKKKLAIKDRIVALEDQLFPDISA